MSEETTEQESTLKMIDGTACYACYAVFAESGGYEIGIKPLFDANDKQTFIGFRVRAVPKEQDTSETVVELQQTPTAESIAEAFPGFEFQKADDDRCSLVGGLFLNRSKRKAKEVKKYLDEYSVVRKIVIQLQQMLGTIEMHDNGQLPDFLYGAYMAFLEPYLESEAEQDLPLPENVVVSMDEFKAKQALNEHLSAVKGEELPETETAE